MRKTVLGVVTLVVLLVAGLAVTPSPGATKRPTLKAVRTAGYGKLLVTSSGLTLYRFTSDRRGKTTCFEQCARIWPPLVVKGKTKPLAGKGVKASLLGTIERPGGVRQVTYRSFPLYRYLPDRTPGDVKGQGVGDAWFVVAPSGRLIRQAEAAAPPPPTETTPPPPAYSGGRYG